METSGKPSWAIKIPRSRRICVRCGHLYASHVAPMCIKVIQRANPRIDCDCKGFVETFEQLQKETARERALNTLKEVPLTESNAITPQLVFGGPVNATRMGGSGKQIQERSGC